MLTPKLFLLALFFCALWLAVVFDLVRRQKMTEGLSFMWVAGSIFLTLCVVFSGYFTQAARWLGIRMPENAVLILGLGTLATATLYLCTRISDLARKVVRLSEEIAILKKRERDKKAAASPEQKGGGK